MDEPDRSINAGLIPPRRSWFAVWDWPWQSANDEPHASTPALYVVVLRCLTYLLLTAFFGYYLQSIVSLPFAGDVWLGEIPLFALIQFPKSTLYDVVQDAMIRQLPALGLASGSPSPDMMLTHPWALGFTTFVPGLIFLGIIAPLLRFVHHRRRTVIAVIVVICVDAAVTFWFDATSSLSIF